MPFILNNDVKIYYEIEGDGPNVIFQTGAAGDMNMWREAGYIKNLEGFKKVLINHRGHGQSGKPSALDQHRMEEYVEDVLAVMDALYMERSAFIGYSDGGRVGFELAASHPDRIACLVSIGSVGLMNAEVKESREALADSIRDIGMQYLVDLYKNDEGLFPDWLRGQFLSTDREMIALELTGWRDWPGTWDRLAEIKVSVMIIVGEKEDPEDLAGEAERLLQNGRKTTLPNQDHIGIFWPLRIFYPILSTLYQPTHLKYKKRPNAYVHPSPKNHPPRADREARIGRPGRLGTYLAQLGCDESRATQVQGTSLSSSTAQ